MDAFSVSVAAGLGDPSMKHSRMFTIAGTFCFFQIAMPLIGWICVRTVAEKFALFQKAIPWIALILLCFIGGKMILEEIARASIPADAAASEAMEEERMAASLGGAELIAQGIATSIDALSVGFTIADYSLPYALVSAAVIGAVTFAVCLAGLIIGKTVGKKLAGKASAVGGIILIAIGIEIFVKGVL
jgi:putative Mn2+ efflux pump MntP